MKTKNPKKPKKVDAVVEAAPKVFIEPTRVPVIPLTDDEKAKYKAFADEIIVKCKAGQYPGFELMVHGSLAVDIYTIIDRTDYRTEKTYNRIESMMYRWPILERFIDPTHRRLPEEKFSPEEMSIIEQMVKDTCRLLGFAPGTSFSQVSQWVTKGDQRFYCLPNSDTMDLNFERINRKIVSGYTFEEG